MRTTICDTLLELFYEARARGDMDSAARIGIARKMAKKMQDRLIFYALTYGSKKPFFLGRDSDGQIAWLTKRQLKAFKRAGR